MQPSVISAEEQSKSQGRLSYLEKFTNEVIDWSSTIRWPSFQEQYRVSTSNDRWYTIYCGQREDMEDFSIRSTPFMNLQNNHHQQWPSAKGDQWYWGKIKVRFEWGLIEYPGACFETRIGYSRKRRSSRDLCPDDVYSLLPKDHFQYQELKGRLVRLIAHRRSRTRVNVQIAEIY